MKYGEELKKLQKDIFDILKDIIRICDKHQIEYFIIGGTALGAVRHKGFIPWDDDIDIGMTRDNYERFLEIAQSELRSDLFLQNFMTEPETPFYFTKVRKKGTKFIEEYCKELNIHHGIFVDIFPYDNIPDNKQLCKRQLRNVKVFSNLFIAKTITGINGDKKDLKSNFKKIIRIILHILLKPISKNYIYKKLDNENRKYNDLDTSKVCFVKMPSSMIDTKQVNDLEKIEFEGEFIKCPRDIDKYLENEFGDYMKLPPVENRVGHKPYILEL